jgi:hypothetical protein
MPQFREVSDKEFADWINFFIRTGDNRFYGYDILTAFREYTGTSLACTLIGPNCGPTVCKLIEQTQFPKCLELCAFSHVEANGERIMLIEPENFTLVHNLIIFGGWLRMVVKDALRIPSVSRGLDKFIWAAFHEDTHRLLPIDTIFVGRRWPHGGGECIEIEVGPTIRDVISQLMIAPQTDLFVMRELGAGGRKIVVIQAGRTPLTQ